MVCALRSHAGQATRVMCRYGRKGGVVLVACAVITIATRPECPCKFVMGDFHLSLPNGRQGNCILLIHRERLALTPEGEHDSQPGQTTCCNMSRHILCPWKWPTFVLTCTFGSKRTRPMPSTVTSTARPMAVTIRPSLTFTFTCPVKRSCTTSSTSRLHSTLVPSSDTKEFVERTKRTMNLVGGQPKLMHGLVVHDLSTLVSS